MLSPSLLGIWTPGIWEMAVIMIIALLIFGNKLPSLGRDVARAITSFRQGLREVESEITEGAEREDRKKLEGKQSKDVANADDEREPEDAEA